MKRFDMPDTQANFLSSVVYILSGVASPICGFMIDKVGRNVAWIFLATCFTGLAHVLLGFTLLNPYVGMVMFLSYFNFIVLNKMLLLGANGFVLFNFGK